MCSCETPTSLLELLSLSAADGFTGWVAASLSLGVLSPSVLVVIMTARQLVYNLKRYGVVALAEAVKEAPAREFFLRRRCNQHVVMHVCMCTMDQEMDLMMRSRVRVKLIQCNVP